MLHTHTGHKAHVGYTHRSARLYGHTVPTAGRVHALVDAGRGRFASLCGVTVWADAEDQYGFRHEGGPMNVKPAGAEGAPAVGCKKCLARMRAE